MSETVVEFPRGKQSEMSKHSSDQLTVSLDSKTSANFPLSTQNRNRHGQKSSCGRIGGGQVAATSASPLDIF